VLLAPSCFCGKDSQNIIISIDLCPSSRSYEQKLFSYLDQYGKEQGQSVPIAIAISGGWILRHQNELKMIKSFKNLDITWVNHSYSHPKGDGFLDNPKINFNREVKDNLVLMEKNGLKPSKFFRDREEGPVVSKVEPAADC
jgi:hypothetical protein